MICVGKHYLMHVHRKLNPFPEYTIGINAKTEKNLAASLDCSVLTCVTSASWPCNTADKVISAPRSENCLMYTNLSDEA